MLGLRKGLLIRKRGSVSSVASDGAASSDGSGESATRGAMETIRNGLSPKNLKVRKASDSVIATVTPVSDADVQSEKTVTTQNADVATESVPATIVTGTTTTTTSGSTTSVSTSITHQHASTTASIRTSRIAETSWLIRSHICKLGDFSETFFKNLDLESYLEYISDERLIHMPRRGSDWDRVLRAAQVFGFQLWRFGVGVSQFCPGTEETSKTALGSTQILLEIGPQQARALVPTFQALYELALVMLHVSQIHDIFQASRDVKEAVADLYCDIVALIGNITVFYRNEISKLAAGKTVTLNFEAVFGEDVSNIYKRQTTIMSRMWSLKLGGRNGSISLDSLRRLLKHDRSVKGAFYDQVTESMKRAEGTCEWVKEPLIEFFRGRDKALTITGDSGTGKTVLAGWIKERLQRPLNHTQYLALIYSFPYDSPSQCTQLAFLKSILFQLLDRSVGDVNLFEKLVTAFEEYNKHHSASELEKSLWAALETGLKTLNDRRINLVMIVDGFHDLAGDKSPLEFHKTLRECISKFETVRIITLSKAISHLSEGCSHFTLTAQHLSADIKAYLRQSFSSLSTFSQLSSEDKEKIVQELTLKAKTSFTWSYLVVRLLSRETSSDSFVKAARGTSASIDETLKKLVSTISFKNEATRAMLSFMLAASRPLLVAELAELMRLNIGSRQFGEDLDVPTYIKSTMGDIVVIEGGYVHFKCKAVHTYVQSLMGKSLPSVEDAQSHLTLALLLYCKLSLTDCEPSFDLLSDKASEDAFRSHALLYYAVRHWQTHFRASGFYGKNGKLVLNKDFHEVFPTSCRFALLERSTSLYGVSTSKLLEKFSLSLRIREACFTEKHVVVLQTLIILGNLHLGTSDPLSGVHYFYRAATLGKVVFSGYHELVMACTNIFLQYTETITITKRTEIVTQREQMILLMIEICKSRYGRTSDLVIKWLESLAKLYVSIKEEFRATLIYKELHEIYIIREGKQSERARRLCEHLGGLELVIQGETQEMEVDEYAGFFFETTEQLDVADERRVSILLQLAIFYESQKQYYLAEKVYITLWRHISEICRVKATLELHITKIKIALAYVKFLKNLNRSQEAANILVCLWVEYEQRSFEDKAIILLIREIGVMFKSLGFLHVAISVFSKVWGWFKSKGTVTEEEAQETTVLITEVVEETIETTVETKTTTTTVTEVTETVTREIFETHFKRCKDQVDLVFFNSCLALVNLYLKHGNFRETEIIIKRSLEISWKAILTAEVDIKLSEHFVSECIHVATKLAICYHQQGLFEKAEAIYLRIFNACIASLRIDDVRVEEALSILIKFYKEHHRYDKVIEIYVGLLAKYRKDLGESHSLTIKLLYALAYCCKLTGRADAYKYYLEIVMALNKGKTYCHHDAFEAAVILVNHYYYRKSWAELQQICAVLWETFVHHHKECAFTEEIVQLVYQRYTYVLEIHAKVELSVLYEISVKYRETVMVVFGNSSEILIQAMIALAQICERHEKHHHESITLYEEVIKRVTETKTTTTTITESTITTVKKRLSKVYVTVITSGGSVSTTTVERAIAICFEAYTKLQVELGFWHKETLLKLKELILIYKKLGGKESHAKIVELLQIAVLNIITACAKATSGAIELYYAAETLASIYITAGISTTGVNLVRYLRHLIIFGGDFEVRTDINVKLSVTVSRVAFVFLVSLEQHLLESMVMSYSELMAATLLELSLYEQYREAIEKQSRIEIVLECAAKLRAFWVEQKAEHLIAILDQRVFVLFKKQYSSVIKITQDEHIRLFYVALVNILGKDHAKVDFAALTCKAGNDVVHSLVEGGEFKKALEVAKCAFYFAHGQQFYNDLHRVNYAYKLAEFMAGIDVKKPSDSALWAEYLKFSREMTAEALAILRANKIDLVRLRFEDLSGMVRLLGSQQNYAELESLLLRLWQSREVQKTWSPGRVLSVGKLLVHAYASAGHLAAAIELCDTMCYNLRRSRGALDSATVEMEQMLAALYTSEGHVERALAVHELVLREIEAACVHAGDSDKKQLAQTAAWSMELLKRAHVRLGGSWAGKPEQEFAILHERLQHKLGGAGLAVSPPDTWAKSVDKSKPDDMIGKYVPLREFEWTLQQADGADGEGHSHGHGQNGTNGSANANGWGALKGKSGRTRAGVDYVRVASQEWLSAV